MEILVCVKRVPDTEENEIKIGGDGKDIDRDDLVYSVNEWDNYAVEEAIQIVERVGGCVTVVTVGDDSARTQQSIRPVSKSARASTSSSPVTTGSRPSCMAAIMSRTWSL